MVDVSDKAETDRVAVAGARVVMRPETLERIRSGDVAKGDVLAVARLAGIMAAKRTAELIPLCHPLALTSVGVDLACVPERSAVEITATCRLRGPHRGRDGGADRGERRRADRLRHVQGRRPRDGRHRFAPVAQIGRPVRGLGGRAVISVEEALARLLEPLEALPPEQISLADGLGRVLAEDVAARRTQPPFAVSAMDGYAVRAEDLAAIPVELRIVAEVPAGRRVRRACRSRRSGAHLHRGAAAGGHRHDRHPGGHRARRRPGPGAAKARRAAAMSAARGSISPKATCCCAPGGGSRARDIGLLAAMNRPWLFVHRRPRIGILSTGDEIVMPGDPIGPHQIVSSNSLALAAFVAACGGVPVSVGNAPDDPDGAAPDRRRDERRRSAGDDRRGVGRRARPGARGARRPTGSSSISGRSRCGRASR